MLGMMVSSSVGLVSVASLAGEVADVFVVEVKVDEAAELAFFVEEIGAHGGVGGDEGFEGGGDGGGLRRGWRPGRQ